eukprot:55976-Eustigmatos_ZCMA.PRE.1
MGLTRPERMIHTRDHSRVRPLPPDMDSLSTDIQTQEEVIALTARAAPPVRQSSRRVCGYLIVPLGRRPLSPQPSFLFSSADPPVRPSFDRSSACWVDRPGPAMPARMQFRRKGAACPIHPRGA